MIDHVSIGVRDVKAAKRFYDAALKPLGYACLSDSPGSLGYGSGSVALWISESERPVLADEKSGLHFQTVSTPWPMLVEPTYTETTPSASTAMRAFSRGPVAPPSMKQPMPRPW